MCVGLIRLTFLFLFDRFQLHVMGFIEGIHRAVKYFESSWLLCLSILACCSLLLLPLLLLSLLRFASSPSSVSAAHCPPMMASDSQLLCTKSPTHSWHSWGQKNKYSNNFRYFSFTHFTFLLACLAVFSFRFCCRRFLVAFLLQYFFCLLHALFFLQCTAVPHGHQRCAGAGAGAGDHASKNVNRQLPSEDWGISAVCNKDRHRPHNHWPV